jgi:regulator of RNase E activity RraA
VARLSDTLDLLGVVERVLDRRLRPLTRASARVAGRATTVRFVPDHDGADTADPYGAMIDFIDGLEAGAIVVIAAGGDERSACWGELFSAAAIGRGVRGVVCDGYIRDAAQVRALDLPVFARGTRPFDYRNRLRVVSTNETVRCGGVRISAGDLVLADDDGIVAIPAAMAAEVTELALRRGTAESGVLADLLDGASLREVWSRHRVL